ncbi:phosphoribosylanthranilate isomerase [Listeria sp. ILCC797]|uniref:phosphoribosylanthranilate isomerase n=1 Tax=Listeria sp. ILCC797 TaxID=1918333 RepID=UPI000B5886C0|nr:phosphoribosylanthranilate isomerase [Listeria sp. ILCC797]
MKVKICGLKTVADAKFAAEMGADMIGFVFAKSKRQVQVEEARKMAAVLPDNVLKVGVFVNPDLEEVLFLKENVPLDIVQLHGSETPEFAAKVGPTIKAFKVRDGEIVGDVSAYQDSLILLDAPPKEFEGGSGETFDWEKIGMGDLPKSRLIIAGGLNPQNVTEAIQIFEPFGVDVSSGVETNDVKDQMKIKAFIKHAKGADNHALRGTE